MSKGQQRVREMVLAISGDDLAVAIAEGAIGLRRPVGLTSAEVLAQIEQAEPEMARSFRRAARCVAALLISELDAGNG